MEDPSSFVVLDERPIVEAKVITECDAVLLAEGEAVGDALTENAVGESILAQQNLIIK